jgi:hypothetical protein
MELFQPNNLLSLYFYFNFIKIVCISGQYLLPHLSDSFVVHIVTFHILLYLYHLKDFSLLDSFGQHTYSPVGSVVPLNHGNGVVTALSHFSESSFNDDPPDPSLDFDSCQMLFLISPFGL